MIAGEFEYLAPSTEGLQQQILALEAKIDSLPVLRWAVVTRVDPLEIRLDTAETPLNGSPSNASGFSLRVGDRVHVSIQMSKVVIEGVAGGRVNSLRGTSAQRVALGLSGTAVDGMRFYDTDENREYVRALGSWSTAFGANMKVLHTSGGAYMGGDQTAHLSEPVSRQATGIVLVWSSYTESTNTVNPDNVNYHFIPKWHVSSGLGVIELVLYVQGTIARKLVSVTDTAIGGNGVNSGSTESRKAVLRYVLGV